MILKNTDFNPNCGEYLTLRVTIAEGTNFITLWVTNGAGLGSETNFMVVKSDLTLELTGTDGDLWNATVNVSGVISEPTYSVWVNGVQGTNYGDGTWSANNVPVSVGGVASFDMSASSGGGDPDSNTNMDKPAEIVTVQYGDGKSAIGLEQGWNHTTHTRTKNYNNNYIIDGNGQYASQGWVETVVDYDGDTASGGGWSDYVMSSANPGVYYVDWMPDTGGDFPDWGYIGQDEDSSYWITGLPDQDLEAVGGGDPTDNAPGRLIYHYYANNVHWAWDKDGNHEDLTLGAKIRQKLLTGGRAGSKLKNLICISANAVEYGAPGETSQWQGTQQWNIDSTRIMVMGKYLNTNGNAYFDLPDNSAPDLDLEIPGVRHYNAAAGVQKYHCYFDVYVEEPDPNGIAPVVNGDAGHAWWGLRTDIPQERLAYLPQAFQTLLANGTYGYYPTDENFPGYVDGPGRLNTPDAAPSTTIKRTFYIGFPDLINCLEYTYGLQVSPGTYSLSGHNCVMAAQSAAIASGGTSADTGLPPEYFGQMLAEMYPWDMIYSPLVLP
jgi:hypothetical protein